MRSLTLLLFALCVHTSYGKFIGNSQETRIFENQIQEMLECIRGVLKNGIEEVGLPSIEPLKISELLVNVSDFGINNAAGHVLASNVEIAGVTDWNLQDLKIDANIIGGLGASLKGKLALPTFKINTEYLADLSVSGINIFGDGIISINLSMLKFDIDTKLLLSRITLSKFRLLPSLEDIDFKITGLLNDEEHSALASQLVNEIAVDWINEKSEDFADVIESFLQGLINKSVVKSIKEGEISIGEIINAILDRCPFPIR